MRYFPLGVAGHVDHGKTSLVKALTSIDTDRLPEEKRRGMSIDIGFAFLDFPDKGLRVEIIDLPGHERFIKNAICGIAPVWGVMLVVDAGEGVMPQTLEHLKIARAFGIEEILLVLTKVDRVDKDTLELAKEEAQELFEKEGFRAFSIHCVSSLTGYGLDELKEGIGLYGEKSFRSKEGNFFRFYVDSSFSVKGYGTVLRGSCDSGRVEEGDMLILEPLGIYCRVRKMQNHGSFVKEGKAGERLALNIPEVEPERIERGYFLVKGIKPSNKLIVKLKGVRKGLLSVFFGMREVQLSYKHIYNDVFFIRLSEPVPAVRGDRGPVLDSSGELVGSYEVLHPLPVRGSKKFIRENLSLLLERPEEYLLLERGQRGLSLKEFFSFFGGVRSIPQAPRAGEKLFHPNSLEEFSQRLRELLISKGGVLSLSEAVSKLKTSEELLKLILEKLKEIRVVEGYLLDVKRADLEELEGYRSLISFLSEGIREERELEPYKDYLAMAIRRGHVHSLGDYLYLSGLLLEKYVEKLRSLGKVFTTQQAKDVLGLTRKYLIPFLEYLDRLGITRRDGDRRTFLR
ncbi:MAG: selenocysteine-specific translation elongation factor [Aquificaceae bacterium]|nr:selenocysteine-specific translation elongation factor [Aquificaceae bacterium]